MFSVQSILGFILGFAAAVFILILCAPLVWRRSLFLAKKAVRTELPLSLKEVEADRDFLRARQAVTVCRLQEELDREKEDDHARRLALSKAREQLHFIDRLEAQCKAQQTELENRDKKIIRLEEEGQKLKRKAEVSPKLKNTDLVHFRQQIKAIAAQTAGFIAAKEGVDSPILRMVAAGRDETGTGHKAPGGGENAKRGAKQKQDKSLAAAIYRQAQQALKVAGKDSVRKEEGQAVTKTAKPAKRRGSGAKIQARRAIMRAESQENS